MDPNTLGQRSSERESKCPRLPVRGLGLGVWPVCSQTRAGAEPAEPSVVRHGDWPPSSRSHFSVSLTEGGKSINNSAHPTVNSQVSESSGGIQLSAQVLIGLFRVRPQNPVWSLEDTIVQLQVRSAAQPGGAVFLSLPISLKGLALHFCSSSAPWC